MSPPVEAATADQVAYILEHAEIRFVFVAGKDPVARFRLALMCGPHPSHPCFA